MTTETKQEPLVDELASAISKVHLDQREIDSPKSLREAADLILQAKNILVLCGAGVSCAAGIPDFRTPGTGLYDNLQKYNLPYPEAVFELTFYAKNPKPFVSLAKEIWPGFKHKPTLTHSFLSLLADKEKLLRTYSQNIDGLEYLANIPEERIVECHGHFRTASCINKRCRTVADAEVVKETIVTKGEVPKCEKCNKYVKPDIVFFGEDLPERFHSLLSPDLRKADLCLVLGTSLQVAPVSMIPDMVKCRRILLNRERVGTFGKKDVFHAGDCDDSIKVLAELLGWQDELEQKHKEAHASIGKEDSEKSKTTATK